MKKALCILIAWVISVSISPYCYGASYKVCVIEQGRHGPITFAVSISEEGRVEEVSVLDNKETRGRKIKRRRFLRQFVGKGSDDTIRLGRGISAVTGATVSSKAAAKAVKRALGIWKEKKRRK